MGKISVSDIMTLSIPERILLVEEIWNTIAVKEKDIEITDEEKRIIDQRLHAYFKNPNAVSSWEDVYRRIVSQKVTNHEI